MQDIENSLKNALNAMRRTARRGKKRENTAEGGNGPSFTERIEVIAAERAEEALYAERYRTRLTEGEPLTEEIATEEIPENIEEEPTLEEIAIEEAAEEPADEEIPIVEPATEEAAVPGEEPTEEAAPEAEPDIIEAAPEGIEAEPIAVPENTEENPVAEPTAIDTQSDAAMAESAQYTPYYEGQTPIGYYVVPTIPVYGEGVPPMQFAPPIYGGGEEQPTAEVYIPEAPTEIDPEYNIYYPMGSDTDGYIPPDLSGGEGLEGDIESYEPDGELNMPTGADGYIGEIDYGASPPENIDYGEPPIDALPPENIDYGEPPIDALPPENIDYGEPPIDALPPENVDYGTYTDPTEEGEIELPLDLGGYPDELLYPEMSDISDGINAIDEGNLYFFADRVEENVKVVEMRMLYEIATFKIRHQMSKLSFSLSLDREYNNERELYRAVNRRISKMRGAMRLERQSNRRYYLVAADRCMGEPRKREKNRARIESIRRRMDFLLTERKMINDRLIALYTGDFGDEKEALAEKIGKRALRVARRVYRSMKKLAKRVKRMHAPDELREKILTLMNERIAEYSRRTQLEESQRRAKPKGEVRRRMKRELRESRERIKYIERDLRDFVKRAERHNTTYLENGKQLAWIFGTLIVGITLTALYFGFKEPIDVFFKSLFGGS